MGKSRWPSLRSSQGSRLKTSNHKLIVSSSQTDMALSCLRLVAFSTWVAQRDTRLRDVVPLYQPSAWPDGFVGELEGEERLQERGVFAPQKPRREGCGFASSIFGCCLDSAFAG